MHESLAHLAARHAREGSETAIPRISIHTEAQPSRPVPTFYRPMLGMVLQGAKSVTIGNRTLRYDPDHYFIGSIDVPASTIIIEASPGKPYVAVRLILDDGMIADLANGVPKPEIGKDDGVAFGIEKVTSPLRDAWARMLGLLDTPGDIATLAPLIEKEILFRVLKGGLGSVLLRSVRTDSRISQVRHAISHIRENFTRAIRTEELVELVGMSAATFHRHFRAATAMSPLQYQKAMRLREARQRLIANADLAGAAHSVGYESLSQFSREYSKMFGIPPARDAAAIRARSEF